MIPLRLLMLEDSQSDAKLILHELRRAGFEVDWQRVENETDYLAALDATPDLILADYSLPQFDALHALRLTRERGVDIPFIIVSGSIGESLAVEAMQQGAADYLLKDRLARLGQAVVQVLEQRRLRSEKLQAEQALRESAALNAAVLRSLSAEIAVLDEAGVILQVNEAWERFAREYGGDDMLRLGPGANYLEACRRGAGRFSEPDSRKVLHGLRAILSGAQPHFTLEYAGRSEPTPRWYALQATALVGRHGVVVAHEDITVRKQLEAQSNTAQRMESVGRLAGGVAHDFNNLLTAIGGYAEMAIEGLPPGHAALSDLDELRNTVRRAATLTRQLLAFARRQVVEPQVLNLNTLILDTDKLLRRVIGEHIELNTALGSDLGYVRADPGQIEQVLVNVVVNARDAMLHGGTITIATARVAVGAGDAQQHPGVAPGEYVLLTVVDTGVGMDEQVREHIFEPFFSTKEAGHGTGLGMATSYGIVKQSGGYIGIDSAAGHGTTIKIYLPRVDEAPTLQERPATELSSALRGSETILLAEDEPAVRTVALRILSAHGYRVFVAVYGQDALDVARNPQAPQIDLLVTDVVMPKLDGKALADELQVIYPHIKVLFISGYTDNLVLPSSAAGRPFGLLQKPFSSHQLVQKVREMLDAEA